MEEKIRQRVKKVVVEPEVIADEMTQRIIEAIGKTAPIRKIRNSQIVSGIIGAAGLALFLVGVEKIFVNLPGPTSVLLGIIFMAASGVLLTKL